MSGMRRCHGREPIKGQEVYEVCQNAECKYKQEVRV